MQQDSGEETWYEEQCHRDINNQNEECEREYTEQRDNTLGQVWTAFQDSATAVANLYKERSSNSYPDTGALWLPFQTAAGTVTTLYKESVEGLKRTSDTAVQCGYQRRTRELADWARSKKRRMIRREDLLAYLAGKALPPLTANHSNRRSPKPEQSCNSAMINASTNAFNPIPIQQHNHNYIMHHHHSHHHHHHHGGGSQNATNEQLNNLHTFKEALVLRPRGPELFAFVANEIARHCKRPASPLDDNMDTCHYSNKRQRFT